MTFRDVSRGTVVLLVGAVAGLAQVRPVARPGPEVQLAAVVKAFEARSYQEAGQLGMTLSSELMMQHRGAMGPVTIKDATAFARTATHEQIAEALARCGEFDWRGKEKLAGWRASVGAGEKPAFSSADVFY
jgi:hypothetical protein